MPAQTAARLGVRDGYAKPTFPLREVRYRELDKLSDRGLRVAEDGCCHRRDLTGPFTAL